MRANDNSRIRRHRAPLARALTCVLLVGLIYSATFGSSHSHQQVSPGHAHTLASHTGQSNVVSGETLQTSSDEANCLICLLHRQFSNSTVHTPLFVAGPPAQAETVREPAVFCYSNPTSSGPIARVSGRAPPSRA